MEKVTRPLSAAIRAKRPRTSQQAIHLSVFTPADTSEQARQIKELMELQRPGTILLNIHHVAPYPEPEPEALPTPPTAEPTVDPEHSF